MAKLPDGMYINEHPPEDVWVEFRKQKSHRSIGVLGGAIVDDALAIALVRDWRSDPEKYTSDLQKQFFRDGGPLTCGVKIDLAFFVWLIGPTVHADLVRLNKIRNKFAHRLWLEESRDIAPNVTFNTPSIRDSCKQFKMIDELPIFFNGKKLKITTAKQRFVATVYLIASALNFYTTNPTGRWPPDDVVLSH